MLNNKGQSLVLFVVCLPLLLLILILVIDIGKVIVLKQELNNISELVLDYGLDNIEKYNITDELVELVKLNKDNIDNVDIYIKDNKIYMELYEKNDGIFSSFININILNVKTSYVGYLDDNEKKIERNGSYYE